MKAIIQDRYGGPELLRIAEIDRPEPAKGEVRVRVLACGVNLSDWEFLTGSPFWVRTIDGLFRPRIRVLGSDIVGIIDKTGPEVTGLEIGQRVMGDFVMTRGGFAEYACIPADETIPVPDALSDEIAACLPQAGGIAVSGTRDLQKGDRLLINGAGGGSGTMALQLAQAAGAHVTTVDNAKKIEWLRSLGADAVMDYHETEFTEAKEKWDRILDMVATRRPRAIARVLTRNGRYQALGGTVRSLLCVVIGGRYRFGPQSIGMLLVPSGRALTTEVAQMTVKGQITPHLEAVLPLDAVPEALARTGLGDVLGKIVIKP